jgi:hypothetical protein
MRAALALLQTTASTLRLDVMVQLAEPRDFITQLCSNQISLTNDVRPRAYALLVSIYALQYEQCEDQASFLNVYPLGSFRERIPRDALLIGFFFTLTI